MIEIPQCYFSNISNVINRDEYNSVSTNYRDNDFYVDDLNDVVTNCGIKKHVQQNGFVIIQLARKYFENLDHIEHWLDILFGPIFTDKNPGKLNYAKIQADSRGKFYINSNVTQPMHTDEGYTNKYPKYVALYCIKQSQIGGHSIIVQFDMIYRKLVERFGNLVDKLFDNSALTVVNVNGVEQKPLLIRIEDGGVGISYSPVLQKLICSQEVFSIFNYITSYVHDVANQTRLVLKAGQILLLDNRRILHGRTRFPINDDRVLYRYWFGNHSV